MNLHMIEVAVEDNGTWSMRVDDGPTLSDGDVRKLIAALREVKKLRDRLHIRQDDRIEACSVVAALDAILGKETP